MADEKHEADHYERTLWGELVYVRRGKKGRPPFERTEKNAQKVSMLLAMGWSNDRIANCILDPRTGNSISVPTLKRHFRSELLERDKARDRLMARQLEVASEAAFSGNVGAMRFFDKLVEKNDTMVAEAKVGRPEPEEKPEKVGKKEQQSRAADEADARLMAELEDEAKGSVQH